MAAKGVLRGIATWPSVKAHVALKAQAATNACVPAFPATLPGSPGAALLPRGPIKSHGTFTRPPALPKAECQGRGGVIATGKPRGSCPHGPLSAPGNGGSAPAFTTLAAPMPGPALAVLQSSWRSVVHHGITPAMTPASSLSFTSANTLLRVTRSMLSLLGSGAALFVASNAIPGAATVVHASEKPSTPAWPRTPWGKQAPSSKSSVLPPTFGPFEEQYYLAKTRSNSPSPEKTSLARKLPGSSTAVSGSRLKGVPSCTCAYTSLPLSASAHGAVGASIPLASAAHGAIANSTARTGVPLVAPIPLSSSLPLRGLSLPPLRPAPGTAPGAGPTFPPIASPSPVEQQHQHYDAAPKYSFLPNGHEVMHKSSSLSPKSLGMGALGLGDSWDMVVPSAFDPVGPVPGSPGHGVHTATARSFTDTSGPDLRFQDGAGSASSKLSGSLPAPRWGPPDLTADSARKQSHGAWLTGLQAVGDWELVLMPEPAPDPRCPVPAPNAVTEPLPALAPAVPPPHLAALSTSPAAETHPLPTFTAPPLKSSQQGFPLSGSSSRGSSPEHKRWGAPSSGTAGVASGALGSGALGAGALGAGALGAGPLVDVKGLGSSSLAASGRSQSWSLLSQELLQARQRHTEDSAFEFVPQLLQTSQWHTDESAYEILPTAPQPPVLGGHLVPSQAAEADAGDRTQSSSPPLLPGSLPCGSTSGALAPSPSRSAPLLPKQHASGPPSKAMTLSLTSSPSRDEQPREEEAEQQGHHWALGTQGAEGDSAAGRGEEGGSLSLGEALCHSQTRARVAEEAAVAAALASRQLEESLAREMANTFSLRQWAQMLELENMRLAGLCSSLSAALPPGAPFPLGALPPLWIQGQALQAVDSAWLGPDEQQTLMLQAQAGLGPVPLPLLLLAVTFALGLTAGMSGAVFVGWRCGILVLGTVP